MVSNQAIQLTTISPFNFLLINNHLMFQNFLPYIMFSEYWAVPLFLKVVDSDEVQEVCWTCIACKKSYTTFWLVSPTVIKYKLIC